MNPSPYLTGTEFVTIYNVVILVYLIQRIRTDYLVCTFFFSFADFIFKHHFSTWTDAQTRKSFQSICWK
jgi:hypothetical protein